MNDTELVALLGKKIGSAWNGEDSEVSQARQSSLNAYQGELYGNERKGYSTIVTREVAETIEWAMPLMMETFAGSSDSVAVFDPFGEEDKEQAKQESEVINYKVAKSNNWYAESYQWIKDALMYPNGYMKCWMEATEEVTNESYMGITAIELAQYMEDEKVEVVEAEEFQTVGPDGMPYAVFNIKAKVTDKSHKLRLDATPGEQVLIDDGAVSHDLDEADFVIHHVERNYTWLVENGFDRKKLDNVDEKTGYSYGEELNRKIYGEYDTEAEGDDDGLRRYQVFEVYGKVDFDGDGLAEKRRIVMIGDQIFENEEDDYQPFVSMSAILRQHSHTGMGLAEFVEDIQKINTYFTRQVINNVMKINIPKKIIGDAFISAEGDSIGQMMDGETEIVMARDPMAINYEQPVSIAGEILPMIQHLTEKAGMRTGINPDMALDPDLLQKTTAGAFLGALERTSKRASFYIRTMAETGFKPLFRKVHRLHREHVDKEETIELRNEWVPVNPGEWRERKNLSINVGLGHNNKEEDVAVLMNLLNMQKEAVMSGSSLATEQHVFNTLTELTELSGRKNVENYFQDPSKAEPKPPPPPDPMIELSRMQLQNEAQRLQNDFAIKQGELSVKMAEQDRKQQEFMADLRELLSTIANKDADTELKEANTLETLASIGNNTAESGSRETITE